MINNPRHQTKILYKLFFDIQLSLLVLIKAIKSRKGFSEKPIVMFTNSTVFIKRLLYLTKPVWSHVLALSAWTFPPKPHLTV